MQILRYQRLHVHRVVGICNISEFVSVMATDMPVSRHLRGTTLGRVDEEAMYARARYFIV